MTRGIEAPVFGWGNPWQEALPKSVSKYRGVEVSKLTPTPRHSDTPTHFSITQRTVQVKAVVLGSKVTPLWMRYNGKVYPFKQVLRSWREENGLAFPRWMFHLSDGLNFFELSWDTTDFAWRLWRMESQE